jgi:acetolactate synthase small subunit
VFIDVPSFEPYRAGEAWWGYRQFCQMFLFPLMFTAYKDLPHQPWMRGAVDGITPEHARRVLGLVHHRALGELELQPRRRQAGARKQRAQLAQKGLVAQLDRLVPVHSVTDLSELGPHVERELALVKVAGTGEKRVEALRLADIFRARPVDTTTQSFVFEISGSTQKVDQFIALMREVGLVEVARGGVVAISRGAQPA